MNDRMNWKEEIISTVTSNKIHVQECNDSVLPLWSQGLGNVKELEGNWIVGTVTNESSVDSIIDAHCRSLPCDFVSSHPSGMEKKRKNGAKSRILWQMKDIPFSGVPFSIVSHNVLKCGFALNYKAKKRRKETVCSPQESDVLETQTEDTELLGSDDSTSCMCPASIIVKRVKRFTSFALKTNTPKKEKLSAVKDLRTLLENNLVVDYDEVFWLRFPLPSLHNHAFKGSDRLIHQLIRDKIKLLVGEGVIVPEDVKRIINEYTKNVFRNHHIPPKFDDEAYYPSLQCIQNLICSYLTKKKKRKKSNSKTKDGEESASGSCNNNTPKKMRSSDTLQDVDTFCSNSLSDGTATNSQIGDLDFLKNVIIEKLAELKKKTLALNDPTKLREVLNNVSNLLVSTEEESYPRKDVFYLLNGECIPKQEVINSVDVFTPLDRDMAESATSQPSVILTPELIRHLTETNQIVPTQNCDIGTNGSTGTFTDLPSVEYITYTDGVATDGVATDGVATDGVEPQNDLIFPPSATSVVYELQHLPEDDSQKHYVSL